MSSFTVLTVVIFAFASLLTTAAQTTNATCLASYEWAFNSLHQSPCLVAAYALQACVGGAYNVDPLDPSTHYLGPSLNNANACQCSSVSYSLISACGDCQNRTYETWSTWSSNCQTSYLSAFPIDIPPAISIPAWAYLDVTTDDTYNPALAKLDANATESTAGSKPTAAAFTTGTSSTVSPTSSSSKSSTSESSSDEFNIIGGMVSGGLLGLALLISLTLYFVVIRRRRRKAEALQLEH